jgi:excisionase family DNA binding protein
MRVWVKVVGVAEAAEQLDLSTDRVRRLIREGRLPAQKVGREFAILEPDLRWFAEQERKPGRPPKP